MIFDTNLAINLNESVLSATKREDSETHRS